MTVATSTTRSAVRAVWLGRIGYDEALALQREAARRVAAGGEETLFLLEHAPVFTLGRNASRSDVSCHGRGICSCVIKPNFMGES